MPFDGGSKLTNSDIIVETLKMRLNLGENIEILAQGISMLPLIRNANTIIIKNAEEIKVGDVVLYIRGDIFVAHRVFRIEHEKYYIMGDNSPYYFEAISSDKIIGIVVKNENSQLIFSTKSFYRLWMINIMIIYYKINHINIKYRNKIIAVLHFFLYPVQLIAFYLITYRR